MKALVVVSSALAGALLLLGCPPPTDGCVSNADCPDGQICNANGECKTPAVVPPRDAGPRDWARPDSGPEDGPAEDVSSEDAPIGDAPVEDLVGVDQTTAADASPIPDSAAPDTGGAQQVSSITTCDEPRALALSAGGESLYVGCEAADVVHVHNSVTGRLESNLFSLPSPCKPRSMLLREDWGSGQLWISCADFSNQKVFNVSPASGFAQESGIDYGGSQGMVRFASGGDLIAWVGVGDLSYYVRTPSGNASQPVGGGSGSGLNRGSDVAVVGDGTLFYLTNTIDQTRRISRRDDSNAVLTDVYSPISNTSLIAVVPSNGLVVVANATTLSRMDSEGSAAGAIEAVDGTPTALTVSPDSAAAYLVTYNQTNGNSTVYEISTDPADSALTQSSQALVGCQALDIDAAAGGRVFVACTNLDQVRVLSF